MDAVIGLDYGTVRVGVAVGDGRIGMAFARTTLAAIPFTALCDALRTIVREEDARALVIGVPMRADGSEGDAAIAVRAWGERVAEALGVPAHYVDEGLTSEAVRTRRRASGRRQTPRSGGVSLDAEAAQMILQQYFDEHVRASRS